MKAHQSLKRVTTGLLSLALAVCVINTSCETTSPESSTVDTRSTANDRAVDRPRHDPDGRYSGSELIKSYQQQKPPQTFSLKGPGSLQRELPVLYGVYEGQLVTAEKFIGAHDQKPINVKSRSPINLYVFTDVDSGEVYYFDDESPKVRKFEMRGEGTVTLYSDSGRDFWNHARVMESGKVISSYSKDARLPDGSHGKQKAIVVRTEKPLNESQTLAIGELVKIENSNIVRLDPTAAAAGGAYLALLGYGGFKLATEGIPAVMENSRQAHEAVVESGKRGETDYWRCKDCGKSVHLPAGDYPDSVGLPCIDKNNTWAGTLHSWEREYSYNRFSR